MLSAIEQAFTVVNYAAKAKRVKLVLPTVFEEHRSVFSNLQGDKNRFV